MARNIEGKIQNVKASIEKYIHDNIVVTDDIKINFEAYPFEISDESEWVNEYFTETRDREYHRNVDVGSVYGQTNPLYLTFMIHVVKEKTKKTNRHYEIRDIIANYFSIGSKINLYDFSNNEFNTVIQTMKVREIDLDEALLDERKFYIYNYTVVIDWLEKW